MSDLITVIYTCGHKSEPHLRQSTGVSDPSPFVCECDGCWDTDIKDLRTLNNLGRSGWCPACKKEWHTLHGATVDVIQTHRCGHRWVRAMDSLHFDPSEDGKYYSGQPFECLDCCDLSKHGPMWASYIGRGRRHP